MIWRAIIRFSLNKDSGSVVRNSITAGLLAAGFQKTKTGTWEKNGPDKGKMMRAIRDITRKLVNPTKIAGANPGAALDHLWVYVDRNEFDI